MKTKIALVAIVVLVFVGSHLAKESLDGSTGPVAPPAPEDCRRIVSMAPSVTETLFALGLGDRVVGVTRYCTYPPEVAEKDRVGGHFDPNFEAIVALRPDLVILLVEQEESRRALNSLGIATLVVRHKDIEGVLESISTIGRVCDADETAGQLLADINGRMEKIRRRTAGLPRQRVMISVGRTLAAGTVEDVFVAGSDGYFDRMIELAGGTNACPAGLGRYPVISPEGILHIDPDVIIDLVFPDHVKKHGRDKILSDWQAIREASAVAHERVYVVDNDFALVPGPRFILLLEKLSALLHPDPTQ